MRKILIIGIGAGSPDHLTVQAIEALNSADVVFIPDKGSEKAGLRQLREAICARFITNANCRKIGYPIPARAQAGSDYRGSVDGWHAKLAASSESLFIAHLDEDESGAFLVWGDPALYDSTIRIVEAVRSRGLSLDIEVIPGISAVQVLAARHRIALNRIGRPVLITTGRRLAEGIPDAIDDVVVMLDGELSFRRYAAAEMDIYWGAYLGMPDEILIAGKLSDVAGEIERLRGEARRKHGWIMDTYLLRRR